MDKLQLARSYINVRKIQSVIVRYNFYEGSFLYDNLNTKSVQEYAEHLAHFYFHKSKNLEIWKNVIELYKAFLIIAPVLQKIKYSYKLDWTRGHFLSQLRMNLSKKVNRKYVRVTKKERILDVAHLRNKLLRLGIKDINFMRNLIELYRTNYGNDEIQRGKLACGIFDPVIFYGESDGFEIRRANEFIKMEKAKFPGAIDIDKEEITVWDYRIKRRTEKGKTTLDIKISQDYIRQKKEELKRIIKSKNTPQRKILLIYYKIQEIIETHKYTKDAFDDLLDLQYWLKNRVSGLAATDKRAIEVVKFVKDWDKKLTTKMLFKKPNFFWNPNEVEEKTYRYFFSPYREY